MAASDRGKSGFTSAPGWLIGVWVLTLVVLLLVRTVFDLGDAGLTNVLSGLLVTLTGLVSLAWFVLRSPFPSKVRLGVLASLVALLVVAGSLFELRGWSGAMVPRFGYRLGSRDASLPPTTASGGVDLTAITRYDFPGFLGPGRNLRIDGIRLYRDWQTRAPEMLWKRVIGAGWGGFAVVNGYAATIEQRGGSELVTLYQVDTGELVWTHRLGPGFSHMLGGVGPRSTPTIDDGVVYVVGVHGKLVALQGSDGSPIWERDLLADHGITADEEAADVAYGRPTSPLLVDDLVIVGVGGSRERRVSVAAYDKTTGELRWEGGAHNLSMASPAVGRIAGRDQVVVVNENWVSGHDLAGGEQLWEFEWPGITAADSSVSQAVPVAPDRVFVSKGYGGGAALYSIDASNDTYQARQLWHASRVLRTKLTNVAMKDGYVYGLSEGILECVQLETGERAWKGGRYHHGQILMVGELLLVLTEEGELAMVEASPDGHRELGRFQAIEGPTWNNMALYGDVVLVRNGQQAAAYRLPLDNQVLRRGD